MLSLSKLLLIALVVAGLFYAAKWLRRKPARPVARNSAPRAVEMRKCPACGVFVGEGDGPCEKSGCPIPVA